MDQNNQKIQDPNTPKYDAKSGLLTDFGKSLGLKEVNTITSDKLNSPGPNLVLPDATPSTYGGLPGATEGLVAGAKSASQMNLEMLKKNKDSSGNAYLQELLGSSGISSSVDREAENKAKIESDKFLSQLEQEQLAVRRQVESLQKKNSEGLFAGALESKINRVNRESLSKQADIAILYNSANRSYDTAKSIADREVQMKLEESKIRLTALEFFYKENKDAFTKEDDRLYAETIKKADSELKKKEEIENKIRDLKLNVAQFAGSSAQSILSSLSSIDTSKPGAFDEAVKLAGKYASDPLDRQIKQATLNKLNAESGGSKVPNITKINGVDKQWDPTTATWVEPSVSGASSTTDPVVTEKSYDDIKKLKSLSVPSVAIATSAGSLRGDPIPFLFKNRINDWRSNVINVLAQSTLAELVRVKGSGVTFGSLSEGERQAVAAASNALSAAMIYKGSGDNKIPTGKFKASEKFVRDNLALIEKYAEIDFQRRTGMTTTGYEASKYTSSITPALEVTTSPFSNYH